MKLKDRTAVVLGGTGGVGEGIVKSLLTQKMNVIVPTRNAERGKQLEKYVGPELSNYLTIRVGSVDTEQSAAELAQYLNQTTEHIDLTVASLGGWQQGYPLYSYPLADWNQIISDNLTAHFLAIRTIIPLLNPQDSSYFHINGFSADEPYPMAGPVAMTAAAQKSMIQTLAQEVTRTGIKVYELILGPMNTRSRTDHHSNWYYPEEIGDYIVRQTRGERQEEIVHYLLNKN